MRYALTAYDGAGRPAPETVEASSAREAAEGARARGLFVVGVEEVGGGAAAGGGLAGGGRAGGPGRGGWAAGGSRSRRLREVSVFVRQLAVLVSTGTPVVDAIASLERQAAPGRWRGVLGDVRARVEQGAGLAAAMSHHPAYFSAVARSLVAAGESGGGLEGMLRRLGALTRQQVKVLATVRGAMVYPALLTAVASGVLGVLVVFVLPRFRELFQTLGAPLPPTTALLMDASDGMRRWWFVALPGLVLAAAGALAWSRTSSARRALDVALVRAPQVGRVSRALAVARVCRVLGVLLEGKVPLLEALGLTRESAGNWLYSALVARAEEAVTRGGSVSEALEGSWLVPASVTEAVRSGERSGRLGAVLLSVADDLDEDNEIVLKSLSSVIEPLILIALGLVIGLVAVSMFLPLFDVATAAQSGGGA